MFDFHLFQIRMRPVPFDRRSVVDEFGLCGSIAPNPFSTCFLGCKLVSASFRSRLVMHILTFYLFWPDLVLLLYPVLESEPDVSVELMEGLRRIDRPVIVGPSANHRIDGLYFVHVVIVETASCGHRFVLCLDPL